METMNFVASSASDLVVGRYYASFYMTALLIDDGSVKITGTLSAVTVLSGRQIKQPVLRIYFNKISV